MKLGEQRKVYLKVQVPKDAKPRSGGFVAVRQVDLKTSKVGGGLRYDLYEDHRPPRKVEKVRVEYVRGLPVVTWPAVVFEEGTLETERVAYYEVFRDGKPIAKVVRDEDPKREGIQWTDTSCVSGAATYTVRAIDEAKNISAESLGARLSAPKRHRPLEKK